MLTLYPISAMMTDGTEQIAADRLDPELRKYFTADPKQNYARLAEEVQILIEMVFGKDHSALSAEDKEHLQDLHDVIGHYKLRSSGGEMNMAAAVTENKDRVIRVMETYKWVIAEVRSRYSASQLKYVGFLLDYMEHVQQVIASFLASGETLD